MRKTIFALTILLPLTAILFGYSVNQAEIPETIFPPGQLIRLHIVANSDCKDDQELKRKVRDRIITSVAADFQKAENIDTARIIASDKLDQIEEIAKQEIAAEGKNYPVRAEMGCFAFPTKHYGPFILPAGDYESVRVTIGSGDGANWWCVLFPPLCFVDMQKNATISPVDINTNVASADINNSNSDISKANHIENKIALETVRISDGTDLRESDIYDRSGNSTMTDEITTKVIFRFRIFDLIKSVIQPESGD